MDKLVWEVVPQVTSRIVMYRTRIPTGWMWAMYDSDIDAYVGAFFEPVVEFDPTIKVELPPPINK